MAVNLVEVTSLHNVAGVRLGTAQAGIKRPGRTDVVLIALDAGAQVAGVFTQNAFCAAPVIVSRRHLAGAPVRYLLINSGNANAGTGESGMIAAQQSCAAVAALGDCMPESVLPFSTGVIGERLPVEKIAAALPEAFASLREDGWAQAARGIMTTDTVPKAYSAQVTLGGKTVTITGMAKGAGMICPNMATMLGYVATDAKLSAALVQDCVRYAVDRSFNRITVDGDTSTNDACMLIASGRVDLGTLDLTHADYLTLRDAITQVFIRLAQAIVRDGEGATKFVTICVEGGADSAECLAVGYKIAHSPLVKTALFASDPNWGRILAAVGNAGLVNLDLARVDIYLGEVCIVQAGGRAASYTEQAGAAAMKPAELAIRVRLGRGSASEILWTTDFSYDYVKINAEYRT
jgi:glutamate N-acetyltransferase / amino-acid N-acetyltransferase